MNLTKDCLLGGVKCCGSYDIKFMHYIKIWNFDCIMDLFFFFLWMILEMNITVVSEIWFCYISQGMCSTLVLCGNWGVWFVSVTSIYNTDPNWWAACRLISGDSQPVFRGSSILVLLPVSFDCSNSSLLVVGDDYFVVLCVVVILDWVILAL